MNALAVVAVVAVLLVAALHAWFMVLEMVLWTKPAGRKAFGLAPEFAEATRSLAANQGLYNGFLVAGLVWGAIAAVEGVPHAFPVTCFFLVCVIVAGVFGAVTVSRKILFIQAAPAILALALAWLASHH
jgi:putative membrane protein